MSMEAERTTRVARGATDGDRSEMASRAPRALLRRHVRSLVGFDERSQRPESRRQFPEPFVVLIFEFGPSLRVTLGGDERTTARNEGGFAAGLGDSFAITEHDGHQRGVQVDLTATGARRLFGIPLSELAGRIVSLRDLLPAETRTLADRLAASSDWGSRLDFVEGLLARRILGSQVDTSRVDRAVARIEASGGMLDVGPIARELGCSHKHLIDLFRDQVGIGPKLFSSLVRFEHVMRDARADLATRWADLAVAHGYSDQAHLAREVKRFTGLTPSEARGGVSALGPR
jgi:AraC-like DNA-binding protein